MRRYRRWVQAFVLIAIFAVGGFTLADNLFSEDTIPQEGSKAPEFTLPGIDGQEYQLSDYKGKVVVLNFWGTYCPPCVEEMPLIQNYYEKYADKNVEILAINENDPLVSVKAFIRQYKLTLPILLDKDVVRREYGVMNYPTTVFINENGKIEMIFEGAMDEAFLSSTLAAMTTR
ncbi:MAG: redoxin domain-containing protein [Paenibacillaceae bacterium]